MTPELQELYAERYRVLRQKFKNHEVSLELWGMTFKDADTVCGDDDLDEYLDQCIAASGGRAKP